MFIEFPKMLYRKGEHRIVADEAAQATAFADGFGTDPAHPKLHPLDHDGDGRPGGSKPRKRRSE